MLRNMFLSYDNLMSYIKYAKPVIRDGEIAHVFPNKMYRYVDGEWVLVQEKKSTTNTSNLLNK